MLCSLFDGIEVVVDHLLPKVILSHRHNIADITTLYGRISIVVHHLISLLHVALIVTHCRGSLVVHHQTHSFRVGILIQCHNIEVRIWGLEIEDILLLTTVIILPADVPALDQHLIKAMLGRKVDIAAHILVVGSVIGDRFNLRIVALAKFHTLEIIGVVPLALAEHQLPPNSDVLHRFNPRGILQSARLIEIESEFGCQDFASIIRHLNRAPRRVARSLHPALIAECIGRQMRGEDVGLGIEFQVHTGIIDQRSLVDVDIKALICFELQRGLYTRRREYLLRGVAHILARSNNMVANLAHTRGGVLILLSFVTTRNPIGHVVARHRKLGILLLDNEIGTSFGGLLRELVTETKSVVIEPKADIEHKLSLIAIQLNQQFVVVVTNMAALAPHRLPRLVKSSRFATLEREALTHRVGRAFRCVVERTIVLVGIIDKLKSQRTRLNDLLTFIGEGIGRLSALLERKGHHKVSIRRGESLGRHRKKRHQHNNCRQQIFHIISGCWIIHSTTKILFFIKIPKSQRLQQNTSPHQLLRLGENIVYTT